MSITEVQMENWRTEVLFWKSKFMEVDARNAKLVAALKEVEIRIKEDYPNRALHVIRAALQQSTEKP